jgi:hypothetical protein
VVVSGADAAIINDMGPKCLKMKILMATMFVLKPLEVVNVLNSSECKYLEELVKKIILGEW